MYVWTSVAACEIWVQETFDVGERVWLGVHAYGRAEERNLAEWHVTRKKPGLRDCECKRDGDMSRAWRQWIETSRVVKACFVKSRNTEETRGKASMRE